MKSKLAVKCIDNERSASLQRRLERHFLTCSAAIGAVAAVAPAQEAQATIHYFDPTPDVQIPLNDAAGIYFNLETGATGSTAATTPGWDLNIFNPASSGMFAGLFTFTPASTGIIGYTNGSFRYDSKLPAGTPINGGADIVFGGVPFNGTHTMNYVAPPGGQWGGATADGYLGVTFQLADTSAVFGWVHVTVQGGLNAQVTEWAWEDSGGQILAGDIGAVPEPSSLALSFLAAGAIGLVHWRRRRAASASRVR